MADEVSAKFLVVDATGMAVNAIAVQANCTLVAVVGSEWIGWTRNQDGTWTAPPAPPEDDSPPA